MLNRLQAMFSLAILGPAVFLKSLIKRYFRTEMIRFAAICWLAVFGGLLAAFFVSYFSHPLGPLQPLGGDYPQFHAAGILLREFGPRRLYDLDLQEQIVNRLLPDLKSPLHLPFAYPPLVAVVFLPLSYLPYAASFTVWLLISSALYAAALAITLRSVPQFSCDNRLTIGLVALSFEPFAFECLVGGQLSTVGCLGVAIALACYRSNRLVAAGLALSILSYKPTLLVLALPLLVIVRAGRILAGFAAGVAGLMAVSLVCVGREACLDHLRIMAVYGRTGGSSGAAWNTVKYVDLGAFLALMGVPSGTARSIALAMSLPVLAALGVAWHRAAKSGSPAARDLVWGALPCWTSVCNVYGPIYDALLCVPGLIVAVGVCRRRRPPDGITTFGLFLLFLYASAMVSLLMAFAVRFQPLTVALAATGAYLIRESLVAAGRQERVSYARGDRSSAPGSSR